MNKYANPQRIPALKAAIIIHTLEMKARTPARTITITAKDIPHIL